MSGQRDENTGLWANFVSASASKEFRDIQLN